MCRTAGVGPRTVAGTYSRSMSLLLLFNQGLVYESLWRSALEHQGQGRYQECVIFAQMAAEVASDSCLNRLVGRAEPPALRAWLESQIDSNANLARPSVRKLFNALSGQELEGEPWWTAYVENNRLRNDVAHRGKHALEAEATRGLQAVRDLINYLEGHDAVA